MPIPGNVQRHPFACRVCDNVRPITDRVLELEGDSVCRQCVGDADSPGRYQAHRHDVESLATVLLLEAWSMISAEDDFMSNEGWGYLARFGRYLYNVDTSGFHSFEEFADDIAADKRFQELYSDGWGASEDDATVEFSRGEYVLHVGYEHIGSYPRETRARAAMRLWSERNGFFPNLWRVGERGQMSILNY